MFIFILVGVLSGVALADQMAQAVMGLSAGHHTHRLHVTNA